jgi:hypothetical protein
MLMAMASGMRSSIGSTSNSSCWILLSSMHLIGPSFPAAIKLNVIENLISWYSLHSLLKLDHHGHGRILTLNSKNNGSLISEML